MPDKQSRQPSIQWRLENVEKDKVYTIEDFCSYKSARSYRMGGATILFSSPELKPGSAYSLSIDGKKVEQIESLSSPFSNVGNMRTHFPF